MTATVEGESQVGLSNTAPATPRLLSAYIFSVASGLALAFAWLSPGTLNSAILGWVFAASLVLLAKASQARYLPIYLSGLISISIAFHWLFGTISDFGGFPNSATALLFGLFVVVSALQYLIFAFILKRLPKIFSTLSLGTATAWTVAEFITPKMFPWLLGHTQLSFVQLAQVADISGVSLISILMIWVSEATLSILITRKNLILNIIPLALFVIALVYGDKKITEFSPENLTGASQRVGVVQVNLTVEEKHNMKLFLSNTERYISMTERVADPDTLVIWPESAMTRMIPAQVGFKSQSYDLAKLPSGVPMLIGSLTADSEEEIYNSALAIYSNGIIPYPYHKRILMPFGEYTPGTTNSVFSQFIPAGIQSWLRSMNETAGNFNAGTQAEVFKYQIGKRVAGASPRLVKLSPLICYEDIVPSLARESVQEGAELLVNLTNDGWFGNTEAQFQHHLIASFRAIENRRYLVRSTNSGYTAVVSPLGQTVADLTPFTTDTLLADVKLLSYESVYTNILGDFPWWMLSGIILLVVLNRIRTVKSQE